MAHVQYDFYDNVFAFLCRSLPSARPLSRAGGLGLGGAGGGDHLLVGGPSGGRFGHLRVQRPCRAPLASDSDPKNPSRSAQCRGRGGGSVALPAASLALVTFGQPLCLLSLLWQILIKNAEQGLIFFSVNFEFGKREHLSASGPIQMKGKEVHQGDCSSQN